MLDLIQFNYWYQLPYIANIYNLIRIKKFNSRITNNIKYIYLYIFLEKKKKKEGIYSLYLLLIRFYLLLAPHFLGNTPTADLNLVNQYKNIK